MGRGQRDALLRPAERRQAPRPAVPPQAGRGEGRAALGGEGRALRPRRGRHAQRGVDRRDVGLEGHVGSARAARRPARGAACGSSRSAATGHEYYVDHHGAEFWIRTNDKGKNFRLVRAPVTDPAAAQLEAGPRPPQARDARGRRPLPGLLGGEGARRRGAPAARHRLRERRAPLHRHARDRSTPPGREPTRSSTPAPSASSTRASSRRAPCTTTTWRSARRRSSSSSRCSAATTPEEYDSAHADGDGERRHAGAGVARVQEVAARHRPAAAAALRLRLLRLPDGRELPLLAPIAAGPRR